jgi:hypothetical protein
MPLPTVVPFEPEAPVTERLRFLTDIILKEGGTEQRISLRGVPRQEFDYLYRVDDGQQRATLDLLLFDASATELGMPVWTEPAFLTAAAASTATTLNVDTTAYSSFRATGYAVLHSDWNSYEAVQVNAVGGSTLTLASGLANSWPVGTRVLPLRRAILQSGSMRGQRYLNTLADFNVTWRVVDNGTDIADVSAYGSYNSKVLLDDYNAIEGTMPIGMDRKVTELDGDTGAIYQETTQTAGRPTSLKAFVTGSRAASWAMRRLLFALKGRQVSFYLPTFAKDLTLAVNYSTGGSALVVNNVGYVAHAAHRQPRSDIRVALVGGTSYKRAITGQAAAGANESLTLSSSIAQNINVSDVVRIDYLEKVRLDVDDIQIVHSDEIGSTSVQIPVKGVLD